MKSIMSTTIVTLDLSDIQNRVEVPFTWEGKEYTLKEASEDSYIKYQTVINNNLNFDGESGKAVSVGGGIQEADSVLVACCTFRLPIERDQKGKDIHVSVELVRSWPRRLTKRLYDTVKRISGMNEEKAKSSSSPEVLEVFDPKELPNGIAAPLG